ncbi:MAG: movement protein [Cirsium cytorhabdovirus 1]|nr:MAG: movement protein [Cirsium cytorhabdovirus 1]
MTSIFQFDVETELKMEEEDGVVSLTKKLNLWQMVKTNWMKNVQMSRINFSFESRAGPLAEGTITASIIDNRISSDISDNMLKSISFLVTQDVAFHWDYNVNFELESLRSGLESPLLLMTSVTDCNVKPRHSLGQIRVRVEMTTSSKMIRRISRAPIIKLFRDHRMSERERSARRTSLEELKSVPHKPLVIQDKPDGVRCELGRSNSSMSVPRKKYYVVEPAREY